MHYFTPIFLKISVDVPTDPPPFSQHSGGVAYMLALPTTLFQIPPTLKIIDKAEDFILDENLLLSAVIIPKPHVQYFY